MIAVHESELSLCKREGCAVVHYDNCPECFGFGLWPNKAAPLGALRAHEIVKSGSAEWAVCPFCKSGPSGAP